VHRHSIQIHFAPRWWFTAAEVLQLCATDVIHGKGRKGKKEGKERRKERKEVKKGKKEGKERRKEAAENVM
jgi:hypothetical protein